MNERTKAANKKLDQVLRDHLTKASAAGDLIGGMLRARLAEHAAKTWLDAATKLVIVSAGEKSTTLMVQLLEAAADVYREPVNMESFLAEYQQVYGKNKPLPSVETVSAVNLQIAELIDAFREQLVKLMNDAREIGRQHVAETAARN